MIYIWSSRDLTIIYLIINYGTKLRGWGQFRNEVKSEGYWSQSAVIYYQSNKEHTSQLPRKAGKWSNKASMCVKTLFQSVDWVYLYFPCIEWNGKQQSRHNGIQTQATLNLHKSSKWRVTNASFHGKYSGINSEASDYWIHLLHQYPTHTLTSLEKSS